jgi:predicted Ser/Thr protein kinase
MTHAPALKAGTRIGHYEVVALLGRGGMGDVYLARDTRLHRQVALKLLNAEQHGDTMAADRFLREARAVASLEHPNICALYEVGADDTRFIAMQYVEGETLAARLKRGPLPFDEALRIAVELTSALAFAHSKSVVHRDLKPQNVMLQTDGQVKLLDFGLAKMSPAIDSGATRADTEAMLTRDGMVMGTLEYMSPEHMSGHPADARSDIFSLALVIYELVAGTHPYRGETAALTMSAILTRPYPPLTGSHVPKAPGLNAILSKALAIDPAARYATAADLLVDLKRAQQPPAIAEAATAGVPVTHRWRAIAMALLAVVALAAFVVPVVNRWRRPQPVPAVPAVGAPPVTAGAPLLDRTLTYWLDVRPSGPNTTPHRSLGDEPIRPESRVRVNVVASNPGFLYLVDQEGDGGTAPLALAYPVSAEPGHASNGDATGWYGFAGTAGVDRLWLIWSQAPVPELDALRPLVNERDLGRIRDERQAEALRLWLRDAAARAVRESRDTQPVQMTVAYSGALAVRAVVLHFGEGTSR